MRNPRDGRRFTITTLAALVLSGVGCHAPSLAEWHDQRVAEVGAAPITAIPRIQNFSGRNLDAVPAIVWESGAVVRLLGRISQYSAPLRRLPFADGRIPFHELPPSIPWSKCLSYDPQAQRLTWSESLLPSDAAALRRLSADAEWCAAIDEMAAEAGAERLWVSEWIRSAAATRMEQLGFVVAPAPAPEAASYRLVIAVETFDWTDVVTRRSITVGLLATLADAATGSAVWQGETGPVICEIRPSALAGGSLDWRTVLPPILAELVERLLH